MSYKNKLILIIILVAVFLSFLFYKDFFKDDKETIKIGAVLAMTDLGAFWAEHSKNGIDLAVQEINESGGINGRKIEIIYEDSASNPGTGVSALRKLIEIDRVNFVIGDVWAFLTNPMIPVSNETKTVLISPTVMDASVEIASEYFFTMGHTTDSIAFALKTFFENFKEVNSVAIICSNDPWGDALTRVYEKTIAEYGKNIVAKNCTTGYGADYRTEAIKTKVSNADAVLINGLGDRAVKALKDIDFKGYIVADSNLVDGIENRDVLSSEQLSNVFVIDWRPNQQFIEAYIEKYNTYPILEAHNSYEIIRSFVLAYENNEDDLLDGLKKVEYQSVGGYIDFSSNKNTQVNQSKAQLFLVKGKGLYEEVN